MATKIRKPTDCKKIDDCPKIEMLLDKELLAQQYQEKAEKICARCNEFERGKKE